jgi:hypothetical protein
MLTGGHRPGSAEWQAEQDVIHEITHDAATSIQKHVRGVRVRDGALPPPPVLIAAQASAEISAEIDHGVHDQAILEHHHTGGRQHARTTARTAHQSTSSTTISTTATTATATTSAEKEYAAAPSKPKRVFKYKKEAATYLQAHFRAALAKPRVRAQRGVVAWRALNARDMLPAHGWIVLNDPQRLPRSRSAYYYHHARAECRWIKPSGIVYFPAHVAADAVAALGDKVDIASGVPAYAAHTDAAMALGAASSACKSAENKCKMLIAQERTCRDDFVDDPQSASVGMEMLDEAMHKARRVVNVDMIRALEAAQSDILKGFADAVDRIDNELERHITSGLLRELAPGSQKRTPGLANLPAMCRETAAAVKVIQAWWAGDRGAVAEDTLAYLSLEGWDGKDRSDWFPLHMSIEAAGVKVALIRRCLADAVHGAREQGERKREAEELQGMRMEEAAQRVLIRRNRDKTSAWMKREKELAEYRAAWARGMQLRRASVRGVADANQQNQWREQEAANEEDGAAAGSSSAIMHDGKIVGGAAVRTASNRLMDAFGKSPWLGCERGCNPFELEELIKLERQRRKHQEGRDGFDVDHPEHDTGKILLHVACFWGHVHLVEYLLQRGANPMGVDSVVTRFTPLDEAARGGNTHVVRKILEAAGLQALYARNLHGDTPAHTAARQGRSQALAAMISYCKTDASHGKKALRSAQAQGRSAASDVIFKLIDLKSGKKRTPLQVTTNDGCREVILAANEWAISTASDASVFGGGMKAAGKRRQGGKERRNPNELGKWLQEMNPNAY